MPGFAAVHRLLSPLSPVEQSSSFDGIGRKQQLLRLNIESGSSMITVFADPFNASFILASIALPSYPTVTVPFKESVMVTEPSELVILPVVTVSVFPGLEDEPVIE